MLTTEAVRQAVSVLLIATPFMFGVLLLFTVLALILSRIPSTDRRDDPE